MFIFRVLRFSLHLLSAFGLLVAVGFSIAAIVTPAWQVVEYEHVKEYHQHGLWENCVLGGPMGRSMGKEDQWICTFRENPTEMDPVGYREDRRQNLYQDTEHQMMSWHLSTLALLGTSIFFGIFGMIFGFVSSAIDYCHYRLCLRICAIIWAVLHGIAGFLAAAAVIVFVRNSYDTKNRFILIVTNRYEQEWGYSFWQAVTSCIIYAVSLVLAITTVIITYAIVARERHEYIKVHRDQYNQYNQHMMTNV